MKSERASTRSMSEKFRKIVLPYGEKQKSCMWERKKFKAGKLLYEIAYQNKTCCVDLPQDMWSFSLLIEL